MNNDTTSDDTTNITFTGEYQFSIRCGKCADIHNAQLEGKSNTPCSCDCHAKPEPYIPYAPWYPCTPCPCQPQPYYTTITSGSVDPTRGSNYNEGLY